MASARSGSREESEAWRWEAPPVPSRSFSAPRSLSPSGSRQGANSTQSTRASWTKDRDSHTSTPPTREEEEEDEEGEPQRVLKAVPCAKVNDWMPETIEAEVRTQADVAASGTRAVDRALVAVASASNTKETAPNQQNDERYMEAVCTKAALSTVSNGREEGAYCNDENSLEDCIMDVDVKSEAVEAFLDGEDVPDLPAPIVQVGDLRFCLPPPALAVQRITELWRPGACMVVITTQHYGTPLLCPDGDIMKGLVNIAPSAEGGQQLVPLFWQNVEEADQLALDNITEQSDEMAPIHSGTLSRMTRGSQLPTMVEEEEDEEELE